MALNLSCASSNGSPIRHLESQGLLLNVFNQLHGLDDLVRCTSVSKSWLSLVQEAQPIRLEIGVSSSFPILDADGATGVMQWIQKKQKQGRMQNVRVFWLSAESLFQSDYSEQTRLQAAFFDTAIMATGFWNLRTCTLEGPFCLETAASLLPTTLESLDMTLYDVPDISCLSMFERFVHLQLLYLSCVDGEALPAAVFLIDGTMPNLRGLHISCPFYIHHYEDHTLSTCFPSIVQLYVLVMANEDGSQIANALFDLKTLTQLSICILSGTSTWMTVVVPRSSSVSMLRLVGPTGCEVSLEIEKEKDFVFECRRVPNVSMPRPHKTMSPLHLV